MNENENPNECTDSIVTDLARATDDELKIEDIDRSHRFGKPDPEASPSHETLLSSLLLTGCDKRFINQEHLLKKEIIEETL